MKSSVSKNITLYLSYAFGVLCIFALYSVVQRTHLESHIINSDTLYLPSIYLDIFERGNSFSDWSINGAPNFFPDMFLFMGLNFVTGNFLLSIVLFSVVQYLLIVILLRSIVAAFLPNEANKIVVLGNAFLLFLPLSAFIQPNFEFAFQFITNAYHLGPFVNALLVLWLIKQYWNTSKKSVLIGMIIVSALAFSSDMLFVVFCTLPLLGTVGIYSILEKKLPHKKAWFILLWHGIGLALGHLITRSIVSFTNLRSAGAKTTISLQNMQDSWNMFTDQYSSYLSAFSLLGLFFIALIVSFAMAIVQVFKSDKNERYVFVFVSIFLILGLFAPIIMGVYFGYDTVRYNYAVYLISPFVLAISFRKKAKMLRYSALGLYAFLIVSILLHNNDQNLGIWKYYPTRVDQFDALSEKANLRRGIAPYWDAKLITMFSKHDVFLLNSFDELTPYEHVSNRTWWHIDPITDEPMVFDFVIIGNDKHRENALKLLGKPVNIIQNEHFQIFQYSGFIYPKGSYEPQLISLNK